MSSKRMAIRARFYYGLRFYLHGNRALLRRAQSLRAYLVLGPLRKPLIWYYRSYRNNEPVVTELSRLFSNLNVDKIASMIEELGHSHIGILPPALVSQVLTYCAVDKRMSYWNPHLDCESIRSIAQSPDTVEIARRYLGAEPIFWLTRLKWSFPLSDDISDMQPSIHKEPIEYEPYGFHYDANDFKSLTFFVYLTDIDDPDCGAHVMIEGTHRNKTLKEISNKFIDDQSAYVTYGERIKVILGKKGTVFAEESSAYHKVAVCEKRRLILMIYYVLARKIPPERPTTLSQFGGDLLPTQ
jgi:hypothetical protein